MRRAVTSDREVVIQQTAIFEPHGVGGLLYWYALYPVHRLIYMALTPIDPYLVMLGYYGLTLGFMGDLGRGRERVNEALARARRDNHAYALASVLQYACWMEWIASSPAEAERLGTELVALSDANGFPDRLGWGLFQRGWSLTALGQAQEGSALIAKGLSSYRATGAVSGTEWMLIMLAGAHWKLGNPTAGLECLAEAQAIIEKTNERREEAELHRVRGELIDALGDPSAAERHYQKSLAVMREIERVASVELDALDLFLGYELAHRGTLGLDCVDACLNGDLSPCVADLHGNIHPTPDAGINVHIA
jgi:tetratricopeptide (TPR) repeat protein